MNEHKTAPDFIFSPTKKNLKQKIHHFCFMLGEILENPLFDILLLILLIRLLRPIIAVSRKKSAPHQDQIHHNQSQTTSPSNKAEGEYIDFEEIK